MEYIPTASLHGLEMISLTGHELVTYHCLEPMYAEAADRNMIVAVLAKRGFRVVEYIMPRRRGHNLTLTGVSSRVICSYHLCQSGEYPWQSGESGYRVSARCVLGIYAAACRAPDSSEPSIPGGVQRPGEYNPEFDEENDDDV